MINWKAILLALICCPACSFGQEQEFKKDMVGIHQFVKGHPNLQIEAVYQLYASHQSSQAVDAMTAIAKRQGERIYHQLAEIESITDGTNMMVIDHQEKSIFIDAGASSLDHLLVGYDVENTLRYSQNISKTEDLPGQRTYQMDLLSAEYEKMAISFDPTAYQMKKVTLYYRMAQKLTDEQAKEDKPRLEIIFIKMSTQRPAADWFDTRKYVRHMEGKAHPTEAYQHYQVIDNRVMNK